MKKEKESFFSVPAKKMFTDNAGKVYHFNVDDYFVSGERLQKKGAIERPFEF